MSDPSAESDRSGGGADSGGSAESDGGDGSDDAGATEVLASGVSDFLRLVGLWIAFGAVFVPLSAVLNAALVAEPFAFAQQVVQVPVFVAVAVTYTWFPGVSALRLWLTGLAGTLLFGVLAFLLGTADPPTSGSVLVVARLCLLWAGSLALTVAILGDWWVDDGADADETASA